jgi:hypothetical protein
MAHPDAVVDYTAAICAAAVCEAAFSADAILEDIEALFLFTVILLRTVAKNYDTMNKAQLFDARREIDVIHTKMSLLNPDGAPVTPEASDDEEDLEGEVSLSKVAARKAEFLGAKAAKAATKADFLAAKAATKWKECMERSRQRRAGEAAARELANLQQGMEELGPRRSRRIEEDNLAKAAASSAAEAASSAMKAAKAERRRRRRVLRRRCAGEAAEEPAMSLLNVRAEQCPS